MAERIDLNADVGEGIGQDPQLIPLVTSINVACGGHAGDAASMTAAVTLARAHGVAVGAHPSFPDREGFGRRAMTLPARELQDSVVAQIGALADIARQHGVSLQHVKPHGALYNVAAVDPDVARTLVRAIRSAGAPRLVFAPHDSRLSEAALEEGLSTAGEVFADRAYAPNGTLVPRERAGAVIHAIDLVVARAIEMVRDGTVTAIDGTRLAIRADTICVHGDTPGAVTLAVGLRRALEHAGVEVRAVSA